MTCPHCNGPLISYSSMRIKSCNDKLTKACHTPQPWPLDKGQRPLVDGARAGKVNNQGQVK